MVHQLAEGGVQGAAAVRQGVRDGVHHDGGLIRKLFHHLAGGVHRLPQGVHGVVQGFRALGEPVQHGVRGVAHRIQSVHGAFRLCHGVFQGAYCAVQGIQGGVEGVHPVLDLLRTHGVCQLFQRSSGAFHSLPGAVQGRGDGVQLVLYVFHGCLPLRGLLQLLQGGSGACQGFPGSAHGGTEAVQAFAQGFQVGLYGIRLEVAHDIIELFAGLSESIHGRAQVRHARSGMGQGL